MREAYNGKEVVELIKEKADINIEIIDGKRRRRLLLQQICIIFKTDETYLCRCWWEAEFTFSQIAK
jgi:exopolyphosphatase/guanosine-5'-triphosphate,3'-diphosphate pyrophosphatase